MRYDTIIVGGDTGLHSGRPIVRRPAPHGATPVTTMMIAEGCADCIKAGR